MQADVAKPADITRLFAETKKAFGRLDILVNNAGIYEFAPLEDVTPEHFHKQFDLNVLGLLLASQEAVKHFGPRRAAASSTSARSPARCAAEHLGLQRDQGRRRCRSRGRSPRSSGRARFASTRSTPAWSRPRACTRPGIAESDFRKQIEAQTPLGRIGQPQDIAPAVVFLASDDSAWITGETLHITGGLR